MKIIKKLLLTTVILWSANVSLVLAGIPTPQWKQSNGPFGGTINCLASQGDTILAGTATGGVFLSTNKGGNWTAVNNGLTNMDIYSLAISGKNIFAGTYGDGVFLSTNLGNSWSRANHGLSDTNIYSLAVKGTMIFAGTYGGGVFLSSNNGGSWTAVNNGITDTFIYSLAVSDSNIYAGSNYGGVFISSDNGNTWSQGIDGLPNGSIYSLTTSGVNVFAGTYSGVYLSTNNGGTWNAVNTGLSNIYITALATSGSYIFAGTQGSGMFFSINNGNSWIPADNGLINGQIMSLNVSGTSIFAGTYGGGVYLSTNYGNTWAESNTGITNSQIYSLLANGGDIFAGTYNNGLYLSSNNGNSWTSVNNGLTNPYILSLAASGTNIFAGTYGGVFYSSNNGGSWIKVNNGLTDTNIVALASIGTNIFAGTNNGVFLSNNNGNSWTGVYTGPYNAVMSFTVNGISLYAVTDNGVELSMDTGKTWTLFNDGINETPIARLVIEDTNVIAATNYGQVYLSTDDGINWYPMSTGLTSTMVNSFDIYDTDIFMGTDEGGVYLTSMNSNSWNMVNNGLTNLNVRPLAHNGTDIFAGTGNGVFSSSLITLPKASFTINNIIQCLRGNSFTFTDNSTGSGYHKRQWQLGDGSIDTNLIVKYSYANLGIYQVKLIESTMYGTDSITQTVFVLDQPPTPKISWTGDSLISSNPNGNQWYDSHGKIAGATHQIYIPGTFGTYYVVSTNGVCVSDTSDKFTIGYTPDICMVTVDSSTGKNMVIWERKKGERVASFNVYKESTMAGVYNKIGNVPFDQLSVFIDNASDPRKKSDRYCITSIDSSGNIESEKSLAHKTLHLTANKGVGSEINLIWEAYEGFTFNSYVIYRGTTTFNLLPLDTIQSTLNSYTDNNPPTGVVFYEVVALKPVACYPGVLRAQSNSGPYSQSVSNLKDYSISTSPYLSVSPQQAGVDVDSGSTAFINVYTNLSDTAWSASASETWLTLVKDTAKNSITVIATKNSSLSARTAIVTISGPGVASATVLVIQDGATGIKLDDNKPGIIVYPNPSNGIINIDYNLITQSPVEISVYDMMGKLVKQLNKQNIPAGKNCSKIDLSNKSGGLYLLRVIVGSEAFYSRVVVK